MKGLTGWWLADRGGRLVALGVFLFATVLLWSLLPAQGLTDDDDYYVPAGASYAGWLGEAVTSPGTAFTQASIDRAFKPNREHPPFAKYVIGVTQAATVRLGLFKDLDGGRAGVSLLAALLCALLVRLLWRPLGPLPALFSAAALLALPRFFFHAQVATLDVPVATLVVFTTAAYLWGEKSRAWAWGSGVIFGIALLTKLNAPFAAIPATLFALLTRYRGFGWGAGHDDGRPPPPRAVGEPPPPPRPAGPGLTLPSLPRQLVAMALVGPVVFLVGWPWLWFDTLKRFGEYVGFHLQHYPIYLFYEGEVFSKPFAPWHMPFTMAAGVIPLPLLVLGLIGTLLGAGALLRMVRAGGRGEPVSERDQLLAMLTLQAAFAIGIVAFLNVPKYGGAKLFMPFFPLFCGLMGAGLGFVQRSLRALWPGPREPGERNLLVVAAGVGGLALLPGYLGTAHFHGGFGLSYYAEALGGLRGATARGYERTYYDIADKELARWLDENARGRRVHFEPNHKEYVRTYRWLKRDGVIEGVNLVNKTEQADLVVLTHERRWSTYRGLFEQLRRLPVEHEKRIDGVPLYTVYRRR